MHITFPALGATSLTTQ